MKNLTVLAVLVLFVFSASASLIGRNLGQSGKGGCHHIGSEGQCECDWRFVQIDGKCVQVSQDCKQWNNKAECTKCYQNFGDIDNNAVNGQCLPQVNVSSPTGPTNETQTNSTQIDVNCQCHDDNRTCINCFAGWYLDSTNFCQQLPGNCTAADVDGNCTACVDGFVVEDGQCVEQVCDLSLCLQFNDDQSQCTSCPWRSYLVGGCCIEVNGYCSEWNVTNGICSACYVGYKINPDNNKECILDQ